MNINQIIRRESGLPAVFTRAQLAAIAVGAVISYGVVSGSSFPLTVAGPAAVLSYAAAALVALLLMRCLSDMTAAHPTPGGFASYAEAFLGPRTGFVVRAAYVISVVAIVGTEIAMLERVLAWWLPQVPPSLVVIALLAGLNLLHLAGARVFAWVELALSAVKALALLALIVIACVYAFNAAPPTVEGARAASSSILAGMTGPQLWQAFTIATMGFIGLEVMSIAGAETRVPARVPARGLGRGLGRSMRRAAWCVVVLVVAGVAASAWFQWHEPVAPNLTPFVQLLEMAKLPGAQLAFTVLMAVTVVSVLNCQIYGGSRMLFSMARAGQAPAVLGRAGKLRTPVTVVVAAAMLVYAAHLVFPGVVYVAASSMAITSLLAIWIVIFLVHIRFQRGGVEGRSGAGRSGEGRGAKGAWRGVAGVLVMMAITASTLQIDAFAPALLYGIPLWLVLALAAMCLPNKTTTHHPDNIGRKCKNMKDLAEI
jgi:L-asparagine transporter-like permease